MLKRALPIPFYFWLVVPAGMLLLLIIGVNQIVVPASDSLSLAIAVDLLLVVPFVYWLVIRKSQWSKLTVVTAAIAGMVLGFLFLPDGLLTHLNLFKTYIFPFIELTIIGFVFIKIRKIVKGYNTIQRATIDFLENLTLATQSVFGKGILARVLAVEVATFYYAFLAWKKPKSKLAVPLTTYKESGVVALFVVLLFLTITEAGILHLLLVRWNVVLAWVLTGSSLYFGVQLLAHIKALRYRTSYLTEQNLVLKNGLFGNAVIPLHLIDKIEKKSLYDTELEGVIQNSFLGSLESFNTVITLKENLAIEGPYGVEKSGNVLLAQIDQVEKIIDLVQKNN